MNTLVKIAIVCVGGLAVGLVSAQNIIDGNSGLFTTKQGPWVAWPSAGTRSSNPYVRAHYLAYDRLPISQFEVAEFEARTDNKGEALADNCTYLISGHMPQARWWSIYSFASDAKSVLTRSSQSGLNSQAIIFEPDKSFNIRLAKTAQAGNWITPAGQDDLTLILRFYSPVRSITKQFNIEGLPSIKRLECQ